MLVRGPLWARWASCPPNTPAQQGPSWQDANAARGQGQVGSQARPGQREAGGAGGLGWGISWGWEPSQRVKVQNSFHSSRFSVMTQQLCPLAAPPCGRRGPLAAQERAHPGAGECPRPTCHPQGAPTAVSCPSPASSARSSKELGAHCPRGDGPGPWGGAPVPAMGRSAGVFEALPSAPLWGQGGAGGREGLSWALGSCPDSGSGVPSPWPHPAAARWSPSSGGGGPGGEEGASAASQEAAGPCCPTGLGRGSGRRKEIPEGHMH